MFTVSVICVGPSTVVDAIVISVDGVNVTVDPGTKPEPVSTICTPFWPCNADVGAMEVNDGAGLLTVND